jgi:hypothetical protein
MLIPENAKTGTSKNKNLPAARKNPWPLEDLIYWDKFFMPF